MYEIQHNKKGQAPQAQEESKFGISDRIAMHYLAVEA